MLVRYGDVYGEVVNIAARLTGHARPDTVLVDREAAEALAVDPRFALRPLRPVAVPGYRRLYPWVLEQATLDAEAERPQLLAAVLGDLVGTPRRHPDPVDPDVVDQPRPRARRAPGPRSCR